jgi:hypothetical protein
MSFDDPGHGWSNRATWVLVCWLHSYRYVFLMNFSLAYWTAGEAAFDRSGRARREMAAKLRRDIAANIAKVESANFHRPLRELLEQIDFEAIADHRLARFWGDGSDGVLQHRESVKAAKSWAPTA